MTMCGFYWLLEMLRVFSGFGTPLCLVFMAILCAFQAGAHRPRGLALRPRRGARVARRARVRAGLRGQRARLPAPLPLVLRRHGAQRAGLPPDGRPRRALPRGARARRRQPGRRRALDRPPRAPRPAVRSGRRVLLAAVAVPALAVLYGYPRLRAIDAAPATPSRSRSASSRAIKSSSAGRTRSACTSSAPPSCGNKASTWCSGARARRPAPTARRRTTARCAAPTPTGSASPPSSAACSPGPRVAGPATSTPR